MLERLIRCRFIFSGKNGELTPDFPTFSCLAVLHNAVVAWNIKQIALLVERLRAEGHAISDADLARTSPLVRRHINPYGRYHFDLTRLERAGPPKGSAGT